MAERRKTPGNAKGIDGNILELLNEYMVKELLQTKSVGEFLDVFRKLCRVNSTNREPSINIMASLGHFETRLTDHAIDLISGIMAHSFTCVNVILVMDILALFHDNQSIIKSWGRLETKVKEHLEEVNDHLEGCMYHNQGKIYSRGEEDGYAYWGSRRNGGDEEDFFTTLLIEQIRKHGLWYCRIIYTFVTVDGRYPDEEKFRDWFNHPDQTRDRITQQYDGSQIKANEILTSCSVDVNYVENKQRMTISCGIQFLKIRDCKKSDERPENVTLRSQLSGCKRR